MTKFSMTVSLVVNESVKRKRNETKTDWRNTKISSNFVDLVSQKNLFFKSSASQFALISTFEQSMNVYGLNVLDQIEVYLMIKQKSRINSSPFLDMKTMRKNRWRWVFLSIIKCDALVDKEKSSTKSKWRIRKFNQWWYSTVVQSKQKRFDIYWD